MRATCPLHITGFFAIHKGDNKKTEDSLESVGCGVVVDDKAVTDVELGLGSIYINEEIESAPTTKSVVESLTEIQVDVKTHVEVPMSCGFGTSGAGAFSTALALNELLSLRLTYDDLCRVATRAEIKNRTGVGDVIAQSLGGVVIRGLTRVDKIPTGAQHMSYVIFGPLSTSEILKDADLMKTISSCGNECLKMLLKRPVFEEFMKLSREFAFNTGLMSNKVKDAIESVEASGGLASMVMLGDAIFAVDSSEALHEFGEVRDTIINNCGAHLVL
jgi:pantoate kinase